MRRHTAIHLAALALACAGVAGRLRADRVEQTAKDAGPSGLQAGVARADITPPVGIAQLNWGSQTHVVSAGTDPMGMTATALVLSDGRQKFAMVSLDALAVEPFTPAIARAAAETGIPAAHIRLAASHTHAGPQLSRVRGPAGTDYTHYEAVFGTHVKTVIDKIAGAVAEADAKLRPVHVHGARGTGSININRRVRASAQGPAAVGRNSEGFVDRDLIVVRIDDAAAAPYAVLVNYACHGTVMGFENDHVSPDWIGAMRHTVEQALPGAKCLFFQGAAGNQGPVEGFTGDLAVAHRLGSVLGHQAVALALATDTVERTPRFEGFVESTAYQAKQPWRVGGPRDAALRFVLKPVDVPRRRYSDRDLAEMRELVAGAQTRLEEAKQSGDSLKVNQANARLRRFSDLLKQWSRPYDPTPLRVDVQALRIGDIAIVAMPGEPFAEIGVDVKKASPFPITMFCGYSNGQGGDYMPVASEYEHGGYEVQRTPYAPEAAETIVTEAGKLVQSLR
ncbi:MAG: neutral/alkaline non-lysosomal ceramidase N-terminal domain-containing protein [Bryobacteraceae bacterium]|nr:neutral/alkaline non-lysosomal ceramidase N-terminal domain-containing protein [Bryobacteraceae bacterium]